MSVYAEQNLGRNEQIIQKAKIHPASMIIAWIWFAVFIITVFISYANRYHYNRYGFKESNPIALTCLWLSVFFAIVALASAVSKTILIYTNELAVTNKKLIGKVGILSTKSMDAPLNKVQNISVSYGIFGKICGYGNISIATTNSAFVFKSIVSPDEFKKIIMEQIDNYEKSDNQRNAEQLARAVMIHQGQISRSNPNKCYCTKCGAENQSDFAFCAKCGNKLT